MLENALVTVFLHDQCKPAGPRDKNWLGLRARYVARTGVPTIFHLGWRAGLTQTDPQRPRRLTRNQGHLT